MQPEDDKGHLRRQGGTGTRRRRSSAGGFWKFAAAEVFRSPQIFTREIDERESGFFSFLDTDGL